MQDPMDISRRLVASSQQRGQVLAAVGARAVPVDGLDYALHLLRS